MGKRLYVTNLPDFVDEEFLHTVFAELGTARSIRLIREKESGRSKGTCFVEMASAKEARDAIRSLNGVRFCAHTVLEADEAEPKLCLVPARAGLRESRQRET